LSIYDPTSRRLYGINEILNYVEVSFDLNPATFVSGQTVCMGKDKGKWSADPCQTQVQPKSLTIDCRCSVHRAGEITLKNDTSRPRDDAYPELELLLLDKPNSKLLLVFIFFIIVVS
jgi:hypothetical protein